MAKEIDREALLDLMTSAIKPVMPIQIKLSNGMINPQPMPCEVTIPLDLDRHLQAGGRCNSTYDVKYVDGLYQCASHRNDPF